MQINVLDAKNQLSQLIKSAQAGEDVVIADLGKPVARLVAIPSKSTELSDKGNGRAILEWLEKNPLPERARRSAEEIDAAIEAERLAWD